MAKRKQTYRKKSRKIWTRNNFLKARERRANLVVLQNIDNTVTTSTSIPESTTKAATTVSRSFGNTKSLPVDYEMATPSTSKISENFSADTSRENNYEPSETEVDEEEDTKYFVHQFIEKGTIFERKNFLEDCDELNVNEEFDKEDSLEQRNIDKDNYSCGELRKCDMCCGGIVMKFFDIENNVWIDWKEENKEHFLSEEDTQKIICSENSGEVEKLSNLTFDPSESYLDNHVTMLQDELKNVENMGSALSEDGKQCSSIHNEETDATKKYKCDSCPFSARTQGGLNGHISRTHIKEKNFKCHACDYCTTEKINLQSHIDEVHCKKKSLVCYWCNYSTHIKENIKSHIEAIHFNEKKFKCEFCDYCAQRKSALKLHLRSVHFKAKRHSCHYCDYDANGKRNLERHINAMHFNENQFKCHLCDRTLSDEQSLQIHIKCIHLKEELFKCHLCYRILSTRQYLQIHIKKIHLKEKKIKCHLCDYHATEKNDIKAHIKVVHMN